MTWVEFLLGLAPTGMVAGVCVVAYRHRRRTSFLVLDPYTLAIERNVDAQPTLSSQAPPRPTPTRTT